MTKLRPFNSITNFQLPPIPNPKKRQWRSLNPIIKPREIKGILGSIQQYFYSSRLGLPKPIIKNDFYKIHHFDHDHLLGMFRKSQISIRVKFENGYIINDPTINKNFKTNSYKSLNPMDYAFIRFKYRRYIREKFFEKGIERFPSGLYIINVDVIPNGNDDSQYHLQVDKDLETIIKSKPKPIKIKKRINWKHIRNLLKNEGLEMPDDLNKQIKSLEKK